MGRVIQILICCFMVVAGSSAQSKTIRLNAPPELIETGFLKHLLPRFSLKTGIRFELTDQTPDAEMTNEGQTALFQRGETIWYLSDLSGQTLDHQKRFLDWLRSDVGARTVAAFKPASGDPFGPVKTKKVAKVEIELSGDARKGEELSLTHCGRCHVIDERNRKNAIGSTPSFAVLRALPEWEYRFQAFYALNPHPSFTQIEDITEPFDRSRPSPIVPIELTVEDVEAIFAYVSTMPPANLGNPIQHQ